MLRSRPVDVPRSRKRGLEENSPTVSFASVFDLRCLNRLRLHKKPKRSRQLKTTEKASRRGLPIAADLHMTLLVDGTKGVHAMIANPFLSINSNLTDLQSPLQR